MPRDKGLEELVGDRLASVRGLTQKAMFGGWGWLVNGNLVCGARMGRMVFRVGPEKDAWALKIAGVAPMIGGGRPMAGWVTATAEVYGNDKLREKLLNAALEFNRSLPKK